MSRLKFQLEAQASGSKARAARFKTLHGEVETPVFMPVGTQATVKNQSFGALKKAGSQVLLANTYHLMLRPGAEVFKKMGGIHSFMNWQGSVLTDSGGYQIFSLPHSRAMSERGAEFSSYVDGKKILLTPELSIETQKTIGSDIMMALDQCIPSTSDYSIAVDAMNLTHRWAVRSLEARGDSHQSLFGIVQGACFADLRKQSADFLTSLPFDGFSIGGLAVGESKSEREDFTELTAEFLPPHLPRYLMGVGTPIDILEAVHRGVDMFDCIIPTAFAQRGVCFTSVGKLQLRRSVYKFADEKLDPTCFCDTCLTHSRAYLHHLVKTEEPLGWQLMGDHNIHFYHQLMKTLRSSILDDSFIKKYPALRTMLTLSDEQNPVQKAKPGRVKKKPALTLGDYEVYNSPQGFSSIRQISSGEVMHSVNKPEEEAKRLYIDQSRLSERLKETTESPLVIWDIGLGAGTNAMAAIHCYEELSQIHKKLRPFQIYSFENNLDSLRLALKHPQTFTYLRHGGPKSVLDHGSWKSKNLPLTWTLLEGDFLVQMNHAPIPDLLFFDPFSYKTDSPLWRPDCFKKLFSLCKGHPSSLYTYSASTAVRASLLAAGFYVAKGVGTGPKAETTLAFTPEAIQSFNAQVNPPLLNSDWLSRWERSEAKIPGGLLEQDLGRFEKEIRNHQQFQL